MGTAVMVRDDATVERAERASVVSNMNFEQIVGMGDQLVRTGFLPKHVKNGAQAAAIVLAGQELGMPPMRALRSLMLVEGKVVENADSQLSRFKADGGRAVFTQLNEQGAVLWLRHPNGDEHTEAFSIDDARRAKLLGKDVWQKYPRAMLRSRVITAGLKSIGWEGGVGAYDPDEAAAFAPPAAQSAVASVSRAPESRDATDGNAEVAEITDAVDEPDAPVRNTEWALNFPFPFQKGTKMHGRPLAELTVEHLESVKQWIVDKRTEKGDDEWNDEAYDAISLVIKFRTTDPAQTSLLDEPPMPVAGSVAPKENPTKLAPGKIEDAVDAPQPKPAETFGGLAAAAAALLKDPKLDDSDRKMLRGKFDAATTAEQMKAVVAEIEKRLDLPF